MTRDEIIAQMTIFIDRSYEAGHDDGYSFGWTEGYNEKEQEDA